MESEPWPAGGIGLEQIREAGFDPSGLVAERERPDGCGQRLRNPLAVLLRLDLDADEGCALLLGLDHPDRLTVEEEQVIRLAASVPERELTDGNTPGGIDVCLPAILDNPPCLTEQAVDGLSCAFFRGQRHREEPVEGGIALFSLQPLVHLGAGPE